MTSLRTNPGLTRSIKFSSLSVSSRLGGFTLIEMVITLAIFSVISVAAVWMIYTSLSLRDKTSATVRSQESVRVFIQSLRQAVNGATSISTTATTLQTTGPNNCWSFSYDSNALALSFGHSTTGGCVPPATSTAFFDNSTELDSLTFTTTNLSTGGQEVRVQGALTTYMPLDEYQINFSETIVNLIDQ